MLIFLKLTVLHKGLLPKHKSVANLCDKIKILLIQSLK